MIVIDNREVNHTLPVCINAMPPRGKGYSLMQSAGVTMTDTWSYCYVECNRSVIHFTV